MNQYEDNIFTKIINGQVATIILEENTNFISIYDIKPQAPFHILIISKNKHRHYYDFLIHSNGDEKEDYYNIIKKIIQKFNLIDFRIITNNGEKSGQEIFHFHTHILGY